MNHLPTTPLLSSSLVSLFNVAVELSGRLLIVCSVFLCPLFFPVLLLESKTQRCSSVLERLSHCVST